MGSKVEAERSVRRFLHYSRREWARNATEGGERRAHTPLIIGSLILSPSAVLAPSHHFHPVF